MELRDLVAKHKNKDNNKPAKHKSAPKTIISGWTKKKKTQSPSQAIRGALIASSLALNH